MKRVVGGNLLHLPQCDFLMTRTGHALRFAIGGNPLQDARFDRGARHRHLNDCFIDDDGAVERGTDPNRAVAANNAGVYKLAAGNADHEQNDAGERKAGARDRIFRLVQDAPRQQFNQLEVRLKPLGILRRQ